MTDDGRAQQAGRAAGEQASATAGEARHAANEVAAGAADKARAVTGEARQQAGTVVRDLRHRATDEAQGQSRRAAETLHRWADDFSALADDAREDSPARSLVAQVADNGHRAADYVERQGVDGVLHDLRDFARRRPGAFLGGAALAGLVVGRLARAGGSNGAGPDGNGSGNGSGHARRSAPAVASGAEASHPDTAAHEHTPYNAPGPHPSAEPDTGTDPELTRRDETTELPDGTAPPRLLPGHPGV